MDSGSVDKCITVSLNQGLDFLTSSDFKMTGVLPSHANLLPQSTSSSQILPSLFCNYNFLATSNSHHKAEIPSSAIYIQKSFVEAPKEASMPAVSQIASWPVEQNNKDGTTATVQVQFKPTYSAHTVNNGSGEFQAVQSAFAIKNEIDNINVINNESESLQEHFEEEYQNYTCDFDSLRNDFNIDTSIRDDAKLFKLESEEGFPLQVIKQEFDTSECDAQSLQMMIRKEMYFESGLENGANDAFLASLQQSGIIDHHKALYFQQETTKQKGRFECEYCHRTFSKLTCLRVHQRIHLEERPYKCDECGLSFSTDINLKVHQKVHNGNNQFKCQICGKYFGQLQNLKNHQKVHTAETPYQCDVCEEFFTTSAKLKIHRMIHSPEKQLEYCPVCHNVKRTGESCEQCERVLIAPPSVSPHTITPSVSPNEVTVSMTPSEITTMPMTMNPHVITPCVSPNTIIITPNDSPNHQVVKPMVKPVKPFKCVECEKSFSNQDELDFHELRHKDSKPFKCDYCARGFSRKFNMQRHEKIHAGGAPV